MDYVASLYLGQRIVYDLCQRQNRDNVYRRDAMRYVCCHNVFVRPSVCPSVRHDLLLCRNGWTDCWHPFTTWQPHQHGFCDWSVLRISDGSPLRLTNRRLV